MNFIPNKHELIYIQQMERQREREREKKKEEREKREREREIEMREKRERERGKKIIEDQVNFMKGQNEEKKKIQERERK